MANKHYRKLVSGCNVCGKLFCRFYGYSKADKKWLNKKLRRKLKGNNENDKF